MGDTLDPLPDAELVGLARKGDMDAYNRLVRRWDTGLFRFARRLLGDSEDARDVCQEAVLRAYLRLDRLREPARFKPWLFHIALNLCRDRHRGRRVRGTSVTYTEGEPGELRLIESGRGFRSPEGDAHGSSLVDLLDEVLGHLPNEQREAILLREYHGFTSEEIGEMTRVPAATVRTRIFYGLRSARRMLRERGVTEAGLC